MIVTTPEKVVLKALWDLKLANGRSPQVRLQELALIVQRLHLAGVAVYSSDEIQDLEHALSSDVDVLESLGFLRRCGEATTELSGAGEVLASTLEYPEWVSRRLTMNGNAGAAGSR